MVVNYYHKNKDYVSIHASDCKICILLKRSNIFRIEAKLDLVVVKIFVYICN